MAILLPSTGISSFTLMDFPVRVFPGVGRGNYRLTICSGVKSLENAASKSTRPDGTGQVKVKEKEEEEDRRKQDYYVNTGYAIRTLREEFPELFSRELTFDIYRDDILFKDPLNTFSGIDNYKSIFWALRFNGKILFKALRVDIVSVWQPAENMIMVRWAVHGIPRISWGENHSRFDGTSEYKLDKNGKIYEHRVHNIALNGPQRFQVLSVDRLIQSIGCPSTANPTYFESSSIESSPAVGSEHQR